MGVTKKLQEQLMLERAARKEACAHQRQLQREIAALRNDMHRKERELDKAKAAAAQTRVPLEVQELQEHNQALQEQVQSLKSLVQMIQLQDRTQRTSRGVGERSASDYGGRRGSIFSGAMDDSEISRKKHHENSRTAYEDIEQLLSKLSTKEMQLEVLRQKCAGWEKQVMELKFELQSVKHAYKEREVNDKDTQLEYLRREKCSHCEERKDLIMPLGLRLSKTSLTAIASPRAANAELEYFKKLSMSRAKYWLQAEERSEKLHAKATAERKENSNLRKKLDSLEETQAKLEVSIARCTWLESRLEDTDNKLSAASVTIECLQKELCDERTHHSIDRRRSCRIIQDLRGELNLQLMRLEQLHDASQLFSPKNARVMDVQHAASIMSMSAA